MDNCPHSISPFPAQPGFACREGMSGDLIMILQIILNEIRIFHDEYPCIPVSGRYCKMTRLAVENFQKVCALPQTGEVDMKTWNRMAGEYNMAVRE